MAETSIPAIVQTVVDEPMDFTVIATSPAEMQKAQRSLILWAARKIQMIKQEMAEAVEQLRIATEKRWATAPWRREIGKYEKRAEFYRKIKMALEAGYYIVPPFPLDIFAIRTKRGAPHAYDSEGRWGNRNQPAQVLPAGEGRYVNPTPLLENYSDDVKQWDGTTKAVKRYFAVDYAEVEFPFKLAKAEIREASDQAMRSMIFDRIGVLPARRKVDPIVCGEIINPDQKIHRYGEPNRVTFFVAWWLDTRTL